LPWQPTQERNQVVHLIATELAPAFYVMDLQAFHKRVHGFPLKD
jgi:hypothetical protein